MGFPHYQHSFPQFYTSLRHKKLTYQQFLQFIKKLLPTGLRPSACLTALLGSMILAFGLYHIHSLSGVTEGGILGLTLLLEHWFDISPAVSGLILNTLCYLIGWRVLGADFI